MGGLMIAVPIIGILAFGMTRDPRALPNALPGNDAPQFTLQVMDRGDTVRLSQHLGDIVVLNFWASWCMECRVEHRWLSETADAYKGKPVHFYGVVYRDSEENARNWIIEMGGQTYPNLVDPGNRMSIDYGLTGAPETVIIDQQGKVAHKQIGVIPEEVLRSKIDSLIAIR